MGGVALAAENMLYYEAATICPICDVRVVHGHIAGKKHCKEVQHLCWRETDGDAVYNTAAKGWMWIERRGVWFNTVTGHFAPRAEPPSRPPQDRQREQDADQEEQPPPPRFGVALDRTPDAPVEHLEEAEDADSEDGDSEHVVCCPVDLTRKPDLVFNCGHVCCRHCWESITSRSRSDARCPVCREVVTATMRIFL